MKKLQVSDLPSLSEGVKRSICDGVYGFFWGEVEGFSEEHYILQVSQERIFVLDNDGKVLRDGKFLKFNPKDTVGFNFPPTLPQVNFSRCAF